MRALIELLRFLPLSLLPVFSRRLELLVALEYIGCAAHLLLALALVVVVAAVLSSLSERGTVGRVLGYVANVPLAGADVERAPSLYISVSMGVVLVEADTEHTYVRTDPALASIHFLYKSKTYLYHVSLYICFHHLRANLPCCVPKQGDGRALYIEHSSQNSKACNQMQLHSRHARRSRRAHPLPMIAHQFMP